MFSLAPLTDLTRFRRSNFKNEVYVVTEDRCIKSNGALLAARSAKIEEILEGSENVPAVEFSDNMAGLEDCLDLVYGGSVDIREDNCKSIYKFGKLFQICEMITGVLAWIGNDMTYDKFWSVYLSLKNLHEDINKSEFIAAAKRCLCTDCDNFVKHTSELCRGLDESSITAVVELLSRVDDIRVLSVMEDLVDTATQNTETLAATPSSTDTSCYLQIVISSVVTFIENCLKSNSCDEFRKSRCKQSLQKVSSVCTNMETLRKINKALFDACNQTINTSNSIQPSSSWISSGQPMKDLNWERVEQITSPTTPYDAIKYFTENARAGIHPCVVVEIVLKWWRVRTSTEHVDMSFVKPFITTIESVSSQWYYSVCRDERYKGLMKALDIPRPTTVRFIRYSRSYSNSEHMLKDCIKKGDGTTAQLENLKYTYDMERYRQSVPAFRYNVAVFPPYGDAKHHWYIEIYSPYKHLSLITDSQEEILNYINNPTTFYLNFLPLPDTLQ